MNNLLKNTAKVAIGTCVTLGAVTVAASAVVGSKFGKLISVGFSGAKDTVKAELSTHKENTTSTEEITSAVCTDTENFQDETENTSENPEI